MPEPCPVVRGYEDLRPLHGGHSGEMFLARPVGGGAECVLRVYGAGCRARGPEAPRVQAGVLLRLHGLVPAPRLIEYRTMERDGEALLAMTRLPGIPLARVLPSANGDVQRSLGRAMGEILGRLAAVAMTGPGGLMDETLRVGTWPEASESLVTWLDRHAAGTALEELSGDEMKTLHELATYGDVLLSVSPRACLVHGDLSVRNVLADPASGDVTGVVDWEFAHAGHPVEDLGKLVREQPGSSFVTTTVETVNDSMPPAERATTSELRERARAADLYWLIEVASRRGQSPATWRAFDLVREIARRGVLLPELSTCVVVPNRAATT